MGREKPKDEHWDLLKTLVSGLAEREFGRGEQFLYDGARLFPEDVADMLLPSMLCLAQGVCSYVGMGEFGYKYGFESDSQEAFPFAAYQCDKPVPFHRVAPFVVEVFDSYVLEHRADIARVFEAAAQMLDQNFSLEKNTRLGREGVSWNAQPGPRV